MPFGVSSGIPNVIIHAKFHVDRFRGFWPAGPPKVPFSILIGTTLTTVLHYRADCDWHYSQCRADYSLNVFFTAPRYASCRVKQLRHFRPWLPVAYTALAASAVYATDNQGLKWRNCFTRTNLNRTTQTKPVNS